MTVSAQLRFALAITCLACLGAAQATEAQGPGEEVTRRMKAAGVGDGDRAKGGKEEIEDENAKLTPEQRLARHITSGASSYCRFVGAVRPAKLMPGQSGTLLVTALLQGAAVLPSPAPLEMLSPAQQGVVALGGMSMQAALPGRLASGYLGRPVYENYAYLEIPVTMGTDAKIGNKHSINIEFKFDLYDGTSAQPIGRFLDHAIAEVEVGLVADPAVVGGGRRADSGQGQPVSATIAASGPGAAAVTPMRDVVAGATALPTAPVAEAPPVAAPSPTTSPMLEESEGDLPLVPIAVGSALLLAVIVLLARKK